MNRCPILRDVFIMTDKFGRVRNLFLMTIQKNSCEQNPFRMAMIKEMITVYEISAQQKADDPKDF